MRTSSSVVPGASELIQCMFSMQPQKATEGRMMVAGGKVEYVPLESSPGEGALLPASLLMPT